MLRLLSFSIFAFWACSAAAQDVNSDDFSAQKSEVLEALKGGSESAFYAGIQPVTLTKEEIRHRSYNPKRVRPNTPPRLPALKNALRTIQETPELRQDSDIQARLIHIYEYHPFTNIRTSALASLPASHPEVMAYEDEKFYYSNLNKIHWGAVIKDLNKKIGYCAYDKPKKACSACASEEEIEALTPTQEGKKLKNIRISAREVEQGKLVGYSYVLTHRSFYTSNFGKINDLGLHYVPDDEAKAPTFIHPRNIRYISERKADGTFWGITSSPGRCGESSVIKITENKLGSFDVQIERPLPGYVQSVAEDDSGDMYLYFGGVEGLFRQCYPVNMPMGSSKYQNNPPIIFTTDGFVKSACNGETYEF